MINSNYKGHAADLFQQYKLYVESAEKVSEWRSVANRLMVTLNSVIIGAFAYGILDLVKTNSKDLIYALRVIAIPCAIGLTISFVWNRMINSYAKINEIKYGIITELEKEMPAAVYSCEGKRAESEKHTNISSWEKHISVILMLIYGAGSIFVIWLNFF